MFYNKNYLLRNQKSYVNSRHRRYFLLSGWKSFPLAAVQPFDVLFKLSRSCPKRILGNCDIPWQGKSPDSHFIYIFHKCGATQSHQQNTASIEVLSFQKLAQIVSVGPGIRPQKGQRDNFTREPPCFTTEHFMRPSPHETISHLCLEKTRHARFLRYVYACTIN